MIGIFHTPKLLISTGEKVAIERELLALGEFYGGNQGREYVLQTPEEYLENLVPTPESVTELFTLLCQSLEIDQDRTRLIFSNEEVGTVSGLMLVHNEANSLDEQSSVLPNFRSDVIVGTNLKFDSILGEMVRVLVAQKLILSGFLDCSYPDLWLCAEVATVFFGFGLFTINETVSCCQTTSTGTAYFSIVKLGALNSFGIGYLLALVLWTRNQTNFSKSGISIGKYFRPDAELSYQKSLEFLEQTNDSLLVDTNLTRLVPSSSISALESQLNTSTPTGTVWLLELIQRRQDLARDVTLIKPTLFQLLKHRDHQVGKLALHLISFSESFDSLEIRQLQKLARSSDPWLSAVASNILSMHLPYSHCENEFARLIDRFDYPAAANAAQMANRFGKEAAKYTSTVCNWIRISLNRCDYDIGKWYTMILLGICDDVRRTLHDIFGNDEELHRGSMTLLDEAIDVTEIDLDGNEQRPTELKDSFSIPAWVSI